MRIPRLAWILAVIPLACGRSGDGGKASRPKAEDGSPYRGAGHGTGEPGSGYGGQAKGDSTRNPASDGPGPAGGTDRATRPGAGNANAR